MCRAEPNISVLYPCLNATACIDRVDTQTTENTGVFLNTVTALTDKLSLTVGVRHTEDDKEIWQERYDRRGVYCCGLDPAPPVFANSSETDPMVSLSYQLTDNLMLYGTYQEGFRGGGTTARPTATTRVPFGPETLSNFEYAGWLTEANHLGNVAYRTGKKLEWDAESLKATNAPEADRFIRREYRAGWKLA